MRKTKEEKEPTEKKKKKKVWIVQQQVISVIRRLFVRSPIFSAVKKANRRERKVTNKDGSVSTALRWEYQCAHCKKWHPEKIKGKVQMALDHVSPVINPETGFIGFADYIDRMFAGMKVWDEEKGFDIDIFKHFQLLCKECHQFKTNSELIQRKESRKRNKK
jgi:hypothetical protein